jgi:hypothetical protein
MGRHRGHNPSSDLRFHAAHNQHGSISAPFQPHQLCETDHFGRAPISDSETLVSNVGWQAPDLQLYKVELRGLEPLTPSMPWRMRPACMVYLSLIRAALSLRQWCSVMSNAPSLLHRCSTSTQLSLELRGAVLLDLLAARDTSIVAQLRALVEMNRRPNHYECTTLGYACR